MLIRTGVILVVLIVSAYNYKLNVPKVLLPFRASPSSPAVNFTLEITDIDDARSACFEWKSSRPEVADVFPIYEDDRWVSSKRCSSLAVVSPVSQQAFRRTAIVSAEDRHSGAILRCDVIVDELNSLEIVTTTRQLYLEDSPELFIVRAKNSEGDTFADLDGLTFDWKIESVPKDTGYGTAPARIVPFSDSEYETTHAVRRLESEGFRGDKILVEGKSTGVASITVRIRDEPYQSQISPYSIQLTVMAFLALEPSADLRLPIGSRIRYSLKLIRYRKAETLTLPSPQYLIKLEILETVRSSDVARFEGKTATLEALALGTVRLSVEDKKLDMAVAKYDLPTAFVDVVEPASIAFTVSTGIWVFEVGRTYQVSIYLVDSDGRNIFMADNLIMEIKFPTGLLQATQLSEKNGTVWRMKAIKEGSDSIEAKYNSYLDSNNNRKIIDPTVHGTRSIEIFSPMEIVPSLLVFPPCYKTPGIAKGGSPRPCFEKRLVVKGGSGHFVWTLDTGDVSTSTGAKMRLHTIEDGMVSVTTLEAGPTQAVVVASDAKNRLHRAVTKVVVTDPVEAEFVDGPREMEVGSILNLHLRVYGLVSMSEQRRVPFTDCSNLAFDIRISNEAALKITSEPTWSKPGDRGCVVLSFTASQVGDVTVTINLSPFGSNNRNILTTTVAISVYSPLKMISPSDGQLLLTPTSTYNVIFNGGPNPSLLDPSAHVINVEKSGKEFNADYFEISSVTQLEQGKIRTYTFMVSCLAGTPTPTEASIVINVGNRKTSANTNPALSSLGLKLNCDFPTSLAIRLKKKASDAMAQLPPCPLDGLAASSAIPVYVGAKFDILVLAMNQNGRRFDNASAIQFGWSLSDAGLVRTMPDRSRALKWRIGVEEMGNFEFYETFEPVGLEGITKITAKATSVVKQACTEKICQEFINRALKASIFITFLSYPSLAPTSVVIFNNPRIRARLDIKGGSGHFVISTDDDKLISWSFLNFEYKLELRPMGSASGQRILIMYDICLTEAPPTKSTVTVSSIEKLLLVGPALVMLGGQLKLHAEAYDRMGWKFEPNFLFEFLPLQVTVDDAALVKQKNGEQKSGVLWFTAASVGTATVVGSVVDPETGVVIRSAPHRVQVFPALRIEPQSMALIAGARFQLRITGGLQYSSSSSALFIDPASSGVTFSVNDSKVLNIAPDGLLEAKRPGNVAVTARLVNPEKASEILAEDTAVIRVIQVSSIRLHSPVTTAYAGSTIPVSLIGYGEHSVFPWGTAGADIPLKATWTVDGDAGELESRWIGSVAGTVRIGCIRPGIVTIRLLLEQPNVDMAKLQFSSGLIHHRHGARLNVSMLVTVVDVLQFYESNQWRRPNRVLMGQNATFEIPFNELLTDTEYKIYDTEKGLLKISSNGILQSNDVIGNTAVMASGKRSAIPALHETASTVVSVKPISYILPVPRHLRQWNEHGWPHDAFPIFYTLKFDIDYLDDHGTRFDTVKRPSALAVRPNRFDSADVSIVNEGDKDTLVVHLKAVGETVIKIWNMERPDEILHYLLIRSVRTIHPYSPVAQIGQKLCFSNSLLPSISDFSWVPSDPDLLSIHSSSGTAIAKSPGHCIVSQFLQSTGAGNFTTSTLVTITEPKSISISSIKAMSFFTETADAMDRTVFSVKFGDDTTTKENECDGKDEPKFDTDSMPHSCGIQISPPSSATPVSIEPAWVPSVGWACIVKRNEGHGHAMETGRNISIWASRTSLVSNILTYPIYPALIVHPSTEISIDNQQSPKQTLYISGNKERLDGVKVTLSVEANNLFKLELMPIDNGKQQQLQMDTIMKREFAIKLRPDVLVDRASVERWDEWNVVISDSLTNSIRRIPIRLTIRVKAGKLEDVRDSGILGLLWSILVGGRDVYGMVIVTVVSAALTIASFYFAYRLVLAASTRTSDMTAASTVSAVSPASIAWRSYASRGVRSPQLWSVDRSQSPPSSMETSPRQVTPESLMARRRM